MTPQTTPSLPHCLVHLGPAGKVGQKQRQKGRSRECEIVKGWKLRLECRRSAKHFPPGILNNEICIFWIVVQQQTLDSMVHYEMMYKILYCLSDWVLCSSWEMCWEDTLDWLIVHPICGQKLQDKTIETPTEVNIFQQKVKDFTPSLNLKFNITTLSMDRWWVK